MSLKKHGYVASPTGWGSPIREKASPYAAKGFQFEVRLAHETRWPRHPDPTPYADLLDQVRRSIDCRIVGTNPKSYSHRTRWSIRIYVRSEHDLFAIRLLTSKVFRVYALV
jgi:hypothetical protein